MDDAQTAQARRRLVDRLRASGHCYSTRVANAMETVPRHEFVPESLREQAYDDRPLGIGRGQVVTAPHLVAQMIELLELKPGHTVLEVRTGSGYHAAVLSELVGPENVITIERIPDLARSARAALVRAGFADVTVIVGDGSRGMPRHPPFDRINVTAVTAAVPTPLLEQLAEGGRLVIPLGPRDGTHELVLVTRSEGRIERMGYGGVRFVPLIGEHGFSEAE